MKLRNKKTGEIIDKICIHICSFDVAGNECKEIDTETRSLEKVLEAWEDYNPEPLIKDEKIRKAVRAWAEANEEEQVKVKGGYMVTTIRGLNTMLFIELVCTLPIDGVYAIEELCGSEDAQD